MLISVLSFGRILSRRADMAHCNTTSVAAEGKIRNRPCIYGVARFNTRSGFRPDWTERMLTKVFDCEPSCVWNGHNNVLFKRLLEAPARPDAYLATMTAEQTGGIDTHNESPWLHSDVRVISFSECGERQEAMLVMPPYTWIRGRLGTFFLESRRQKPSTAQLVLSPW